MSNDTPELSKDASDAIIKAATANRSLLKRSPELGAEDVLYIAIDPVLAALGWEMRNPKAVRRVSGSTLVMMSNGKAMFEVKSVPIFESLPGEYAGPFEAADWTVISNGIEWAIFGKSGGRAFRSANMTSAANTKSALPVLALLQQTAPTKSPLNEAYVAETIDDDVDAALEKIMSSKELADLIRAQLGGANADVDTGTVMAALARRADATTSTPAAAPATPAPAAKAKPKAKTAAKPKTAKTAAKPKAAAKPAANDAAPAATPAAAEAVADASKTTTKPSSKATKAPATAKKTTKSAAKATTTSDAKASDKAPAKSTKPAAKPAAKANAKTASKPATKAASSAPKKATANTAKKPAKAAAAKFDPNAVEWPTDATHAMKRKKTIAFIKHNAETDETVLLPGSYLVAEIGKSLNKQQIDMRNEAEKDGTLKPESGMMKVEKPLTFANPRLAATFAAGTLVKDISAWTTQTGAEIQSKLTQPGATEEPAPLAAAS